MKRSWLVPLFFVTALTWATTVVPMSIERLTVASTHIVHVRAIDHRSAWNAQHDRIFTYTRFQVLDALKGTAPLFITVKQLGGHADGYTMRVAGVRSWLNGEEAVLFLQQTSEPATFAVTGLMQGDFRVARKSSGETVVSNGVPDTTELSASGSVQQYMGTRMSLAELQLRVRKADSR